MQERIKVMHIYKYLYDGGTEKYIYTLMRNMDQTRYEFSVCCLNERGFGADKFSNAGIRVHVLNVRRNAGWRGSFQNIGQILRLVRLLRNEKIKIVHSHDNYPAAYARIAAWMARVPLVFITYHNLYFWLSPKKHAINRMLARITTRIATVTAAVKQYSLQHDRIPEEKYEVIHNGIRCLPIGDKEAHRMRYRNEFSIPENAVLIGNVATLSERKGQKTLLHSLARLVAENVDAYVMIVGSDREKEEPFLRAELDEIAAVAHIADRVIYTGSRDDVLDILFAFDIFVLPSLTEGFGLALVEAMCAEIPTVVSDIPALVEVSGDGKYSQVFKVGDSDDLSCKLKYILDHPENSRNIATLSREFVLNNYSVEKMIEKYEKLYASCLHTAGLQ
jgi:glycosyltransferase involved in cell wall biosynthesis